MTQGHKTNLSMMPELRPELFTICCVARMDHYSTVFYLFEGGKDIVPFLTYMVRKLCN